MFDAISSENDYKKQQEAIRSRVQAAAKGSDSQVLKSKAKVMEAKADKMISENCQLARMLFDESMDMYRCGDMTFSEMVDDLTKALKAIDNKDYAQGSGSKADKKSDTKK